MNKRNKLSSKIVDDHLINDLYKLCEFREDQKWSLLYRASKHGFQKSNFHANCDNKPKTLTIIKLSNGNIFGGYTDQSWDSTSGYKSDQNAFLFSLINVYKQPTKIKINQNYAGQAIYCFSYRGIAFGYPGSELEVLSGRSNTTTRGRSSLKDCYQPKNYPQGANASNFLAGSSDFDVIDIEVFMKI